MPNITIYTDGSYRRINDTGGWACLIVDENSDSEIILYGSVTKTTSNRMEMVAVINALEYVNSKYGRDCTITVNTDSKYIESPINKKYLYSWIDSGFAGKKNIDLWVKLYGFMNRFDIKFNWVRGHDGNTNNELVNYYAGLVCDENFNTELSFTIRRRKNDKYK